MRWMMEAAKLCVGPSYDPVKHVHGGSEAGGVAGTGARLSHDLDYRV